MIVRSQLRGALSMLAIHLVVGACLGCKANTTPVVDPVLSLLPKQTHTVAAFDLQGIKQSPLWQALRFDHRLPDQKVLADIKARAGFDPLTDIRRIVVAFPEHARASGQFAVVIYGAKLDEKRLVAYARDQAKLAGIEITQEEHAGQRLWVQRNQHEQRAGFFLGDHTFVMGGGDWAFKMAELLAAKGQDSAAHVLELANLCRRTGVDHAAWLASLVPSATRTQLAADPRFQAASSVGRVAITLNVADGLKLTARAELSEAQAATTLAGQLERYAVEFRQSPQVLLLGLGPWLQGLDVVAKGPKVQVDVHLPPDQTQALAERVAGLLSLSRDWQR